MHGYRRVDTAGQCESSLHVGCRTVSASTVTAGNDGKSRCRTCIEKARQNAQEYQRVQLELAAVEKELALRKEARVLKHQLAVVEKKIALQGELVELRRKLAACGRL